MVNQIVITVNIFTGNVGRKMKDTVSEVELDTVNKYLEKGYIVVDRFTSTTNSTFNINITFILQKETKNISA